MVLARRVIYGGSVLMVLMGLIACSTPPGYHWCRGMDSYQPLLVKSSYAP